MKAYAQLSVFTLAAFVIGLIFGDAIGFSGIENDTITLSVTNAVFLLFAVVSTTIGIIAIIFSWLFYTNSQSLNQASSKILADITLKISKIDDIITKQHDKLLEVVIGGARYEGTVAPDDILILDKVPKKTTKKRVKKK